jgi:hypothetical protein
MTRFFCFLVLVVAAAYVGLYIGGGIARHQNAADQAYVDMLDGIGRE